MFGLEETNHSSYIGVHIVVGSTVSHDRETWECSVGGLVVEQGDRYGLLNTKIQLLSFIFHVHICSVNSLSTLP